jgi:hypothetical protein
MSDLAVFIILAISVAGMAIGLFFIYSVVMRRPWLEKEFFQFPLTFGWSFLNRLNYIWFGIVLIIFFGFLFYAVFPAKIMK